MTAYQHVRNNKEEVPWRVKVAILPNGMMLETFDNMVHYEGIYDANKGIGALELMKKIEPELAN